jgi:DNA-binding transcriptional MerR regulator
MQEQFFTSKQAAEITGCTLRQLQYWREKEVIVPTISATGTGRSIYYSKPNLVELAGMAYLLSVGLSFDIASSTLAKLQGEEPDLFTSGKGKRWMLVWDGEKLELVEYNRKVAIASLDEGKPVIPVWLDEIYQQVANKLPKSDEP